MAEKYVIRSLTSVHTNIASDTSRQDAYIQMHGAFTLLLVGITTNSIQLVIAKEGGNLF